MKKLGKATSFLRLQSRWAATAYNRYSDQERMADHHDGGCSDPGRVRRRAFLDRAQTAEAAFGDAALERSIAAAIV